MHLYYGLILKSPLVERIYKKKKLFFHLTASCGEPPKVPNAKLFGKKRLRYETNTKLRYYCEEGFVQKLNPVIRCLPDGQWEQPLITCRPSKRFHWLKRLHCKNTQKLMQANKLTCSE